ncbi:MAG: hypothetical protein K2I18_08130 [Paramuribaculum sp.]|nr:hypothetical protein [Paramuribaculum sp.]
MLENLIENVDYEWVELPSKGECYPHKKSRVPVGYLRAIDENIMVSSKYILSQTVCDELLRLKILDKDFNPDTLCVGDRNAILVWLRRTGYSDTIVNPTTNQEIDLSTLKYKDFNLKGDENGYFSYLLDNGDVIKYRLLTHSDEQGIIEKLKDNTDEMETAIMLECIVSYNGSESKSEIKEYIHNLSEMQTENFLKYIITTNPDIDFNGIDIAIDDSLFTELNKINSFE